MRMQIPRLPRRIFSNPTDDSAVGYGNDRCSPPVAAAAGEVQSQPEFSLLSSLDSLYAAGLVLVQNSDDPHGDRASVLRQRGGQVCHGIEALSCARVVVVHRGCCALLLFMFHSSLCFMRGASS